MLCPVQHRTLYLEWWPDLFSWLNTHCTLWLCIQKPQDLLLFSRTLFIPASTRRILYILCGQWSLVGDTCISPVPNHRFFLFHNDTTYAIVINSEVQGCLREGNSSKTDDVWMTTSPSIGVQMECRDTEYLHLGINHRCWTLGKTLKK